MNRLLISYDLVSSGQNYSQISSYLSGMEESSKPLESLWVIKTSKTHLQVRDEIMNNFLDSNDKLLVIDITNDVSSWYNIINYLQQ